MNSKFNGKFSLKYQNAFLYKKLTAIIVFILKSFFIFLL